MSLSVVRVLILSLFELGIFFEEILEGELGFPVLSEVPANVDEKFFLAVSLEVVDIAGDKPKMDVFDVIVMHLILNQLPDINLLS